MAFTKLQTKLNKALVQNENGNYALRTTLSGDETIANLDAQGPAFVLDGINDKIAAADNANLNITTNDFSMYREIYVPNLTAPIVLWTKYEDADNWWLFQIETTGAITWSAEVGGVDKGSYTSAVGIVTAGKNIKVGFVSDRDGVKGKIYFALLPITTTETTAMAITTLTNTGALNWGFDGASAYSEYQDQYGSLWNLAHTAAQVKDIKNIPAKWQYGSQTQLTSGTLEIGQEYIIDDWITADDFTNVGGANVDGTVFIATDTTPTTWTNSSTVRPLGAVALYDNTSISATTWYDKANGNDGDVTGAEVLNPPSVTPLTCLHSVILQVEPGDTAGTNIDVSSVGAGIAPFNPSATTDGTDIAKSGSSGSFSLNSGGTTITLGLTAEVVGIMGAPMSMHDINSSSISESYFISPVITAGNIDIRIRKRGSQTPVDWTTIMDAGDKAEFYLTYITST